MRSRKERSYNNNIKSVSIFWPFIHYRVPTSNFLNRVQILSPSLVLSTYVPLSLPSLIYLRPYIPTYLPSFVFHLSIYTSFLIFFRRIFSTTFFYCVSRSYSFALLLIVLIYISLSLFLSTSSPSQCLYISLYLISLSLFLSLSHTHSIFFSFFVPLYLCPFPYLCPSFSLSLAMSLRFSMLIYYLL